MPIEKADLNKKEHVFPGAVVISIAGLFLERLLCVKDVQAFLKEKNSLLLQRNGLQLTLQG
jgi:hypothetical protein